MLVESAAILRGCRISAFATCDSMTNQLIPPPDLAPPSVKHLPFEKRIELWAELVDRCEAFLLAGLRSRIGPGAICKLPTATGTREAWKTTRKHKFSSWRTYLVVRLPVATEAAPTSGCARAVGSSNGRNRWHRTGGMEPHPATRDVDILIAVDRSAVDPILDVLRSHGCRSKKSTPIIAVGEHHFVQLLYTPPGEFYDVQFDLLLAESELQHSAMAPHCDDLILFKLLACRLIDRADAAMLLRENRDAIDFSYLLSWVARLDLSMQFAEIWEEAYPGEDLRQASLA